MHRQHIHREGFALPTVLMASIVMLAVLAVSVSSVVAVRTSLRVQYYQQLATAAGEAGVAYANACLAKNGNVAQWSTLSPLTPATDCAGNVTVEGCPTADACSVMVNDTLRSSFSVGDVTTDIDGKAVSIPNNGYVELIRASNGAVWRTYKQPAAQAAVVPDLCSGAAGSALGWSNATLTSQQSALPNSASARTISVSSDAVLGAGSIYLRKDFTVTDVGTYTISAQTPASSSVASIYVDGTFVKDIQGQVGTATKYLSSGCHTILVKLTNKTVTTSTSNLTAAVQKAGAEPIVATDSSWRVSSGNTVHFSQSDYNADSNVWTPAVANVLVSSLRSAWTSTTGDPFAMFVQASCTSSCASASTTYFRSSSDIIVPTDTVVKMYYHCDDICDIYLDGNLVGSYTYATATAESISQQTFTLSGGVAHRLGVVNYNSSGAQRIALTLQDKSSSIVYARSDATWRASNTWTAGTVAFGDQPKSYEASFQPSPYNMPAPSKTYDVLVVGGGGGGGGACTTCAGGGGGGGGGVIYSEGITATTGAGKTVTVGAAGTAGVGGASRARGTSGGNSQFGSLIATGGGGGGAQNTSITTGLGGGSGGGGSGGGSPAAGPGGAGTSGQGNSGGAGTTTSTYGSGGGGGFIGPGVAGTSTTSGNGGGGFTSTFSGAINVYAAGGGAGGYGTGTFGVSEVTAGNGADAATNAGVGYAAVANSGSGGGGGNGSTLGKAGGNGGSGVVIVRFVQGSLTIGSLTGLTYSTSTVSINGISYTVYKFTAGTGTFTISAIN